MSVQNPFWHGTPVPVEKFIGRHDKIQGIVGRIITGQSSAITAAPRSGKTSILQYLIKKNPVELYGEEVAQKLIFSYLDSYNWSSEFKPMDFWKEALIELKEDSNQEGLNELAEAYQIAEKNNFDRFSIQKLIDKLVKFDKKLVLMVDGMESILNYSSEQWDARFFGNLRTLASLSGGAFVLIMTVNKSLYHFQKEVQTLTNSDSPYFNFLYEFRLGALSESEIDELLGLGNFSQEDIDFIKDIAGGHPYLSQVLSFFFWSYPKKDEDVITRHQKILERFYTEVHEDLFEIWQSWPSALREAFSAVALAQLKEFKDMLKKGDINVDRISHYIPPLKLDLEILKYYGFVTEDDGIQGGWRVVPRIFLPFILLNFKQEYKERLPKDMWGNLFFKNAIKTPVKPWWIRPFS